MLFARLSEVTATYIALQAELLARHIKIADRSVPSIFSSRHQVASRFAILMSEMRARLTANFTGDDSQRISEHEADWTGLNNICRLLMDEITHQGERIDNFHALLNAANATDSTNKSFRQAGENLQWAKWGILVSVVLSMAQLYFAWKGEKMDTAHQSSESPPSIKAAPAPTSDSEYRNTNLLLVDEVKKASSANARAMEGLVEQITLLRTSITEKPLTPERLSQINELDSLKDTLIELRHTLEVEMLKKSGDSHDLGARLETIRGSLADLKNAVDKIKLPSINVNVAPAPASPPQVLQQPKRAIGVINIDTK